MTSNQLPLTDLSITLLLREPFFGHLLAALPRQTATATADVALAVGGEGLVLLVHPDWADRAGDCESALVKHELLHLLFRHPAEAEWARRFPLYSLAAELQVNQNLPEVERLAGAIAPALLDWPPDPGVSARTYYRRLEVAWLHWLRQEGRPALPWLSLVGQGDSPGHPFLDKHRLWLPPGREQPERNSGRLDRQIDNLLRQSAQRAGDAIPAGLRMWIEPSPGDKPGADWRRVLRLFAAGARRTCLRDTIRRPSARYGAAPGLQIRRGLRLLVVVDTSASVKEEVLHRFFAEIHHLWWRQGADVHLVECDAIIRRQYPYTGAPPAFVSGRGGTLFDAPLEWAGDVYRPDGILYFTDGEGPPPRVRTPCPLLWVLTGERGGHLPGRKVRLPD